MANIALIVDNILSDSGVPITSSSSGTSGTSGTSGETGSTGTSGTSGTSGATGIGLSPLSFSGSATVQTDPVLSIGTTDIFFGYKLDYAPWADGQYVTFSDQTSSVVYGGRLFIQYAGGFGWAFKLYEVLTVSGSSSNATSSDWTMSFAAAPSGTNGTSGTSGADGAGTSGTSGTSGTGTSGTSGTGTLLYGTFTQSITLPLAPYYIGESAFGGVIGYILVSGDPGYDAAFTKGLVVSTTTLSTNAPWGCSGTSITTLATIGSGNQNTINIMAGCATAGIAARLCGDLVQGGYTDWYLPSTNELVKLYLNRVAIGGFIITGNIFYWTSTQNNTTSAFVVNFTNGFSTIANAKTSIVTHTRAIRAFSVPIN